MADKHSEQNPVETLADEFAKRLRRGETPSIDDYVKRYPNHADEIQSLFPSIAMMEQLKRQKKESQDRRPVTVKTPADLPKKLGDFRILREIGRGGMGIVYEAWQESLARRVALKVLPTEGMGRSQKQIERFLREAKAAGRLHHTNIVPVFGVGQYHGIYYYVMQLIEGYGLDVLVEHHQQRQKQAGAETDNNVLLINTEIASANTGQTSRDPRFADVTLWTSDKTETFNAQESATARHPDDSNPDDIRRSVTPGDSTSFLQLDWTQIADIGIQVAQAVHYAHRQGILHRDIKPSNLLIDQEHNVWITDFGLAKAAENNKLTQTGDVVGTLRYMAPEQFEGTCNALSEVYSLGITLYELAALQPAFAQESRMELIRKIMEGSVHPLRELRPKIPRDLETIIQKATAREASQRYPTARHLANDLTRFRDDQPILARRSSPLQKLTYWGRRNRALAISSSTAVCLLLMVAVVASIGYLVTSAALNKLSDQQTQLKQQQEKAETAEKLAKLKRKEAEEQYRRAEQNLKVAMETLEGIFVAVGRPQTPQHLTEFGDQQSGLTTSQAQSVTPSEARLLEEILTFYDQFIITNADDITLQLKRAEAHQRVGNIQLMLGNLKSAETAYQNALKDYHTLHRKFPRNKTYPLRAISVQNELGLLYRTAGGLLKSVKAHREALSLLEKLPTDIRQTADARFQHARTYNFLGLQRPRGSRTGKGEAAQATQLTKDILDELNFSPPQLHFQAQKMLEELIEEDPDNPTYKIELVRSLSNTIRASNRPQSRANPWLMWQDAVAILDELVEKEPDNPTYLYELGLLYVLKVKPGNQFVPLPRLRGRLDNAVRICHDLYDGYPHVADYRKLLVSALYNRTEFELRSSNPLTPLGLDHADVLIREAIYLQRELCGQFDDSLEPQITLNKLLHRLSEIHDRLNRSGDAQKVLEGAIQDFERFLVAHPKYQDTQRILIADYEYLGLLFEKDEQIESAKEAFDKAEELRTKFNPINRAKPQASEPGKNAPR